MEALRCLQGPLNRGDVRVSVVAVTPHLDARLVFREPVWDEADSILAHARGCLDGLSSTSEAVLLTGDAGRALVDYAERQQAGLILIGARGFGPTRRQLMGSVSGSVVYRAPCSVLVTRPRPSVWRRVLVGFDESPDIDAGLDILSRCQPPPDGRVALVHVVRGRPPFPRSMQRRGLPTDAQIAGRALYDIASQARLKLAVARRNLLASGWPQVDSFIEVGHPAARLKMRVAHDSTDLVVLGALGRRGIRMQPGSVSHRLLEASSCSVLIARKERAPRAVQPPFIIPV